MARKTQSLVSLNTKLSAVNIMTIATDGATSFAEGAPVTINATTGKAATASGQSPLVAVPKAVFVNFVDSDRSDVGFIQTDKFDSTAPSINVTGGGLACIVGNGVDIGLGAASWEGGALPTIGYAVTISADGTQFAAESPTAVNNASPSNAHTYYGLVYRHYNGRAHFLFNSVPSVLR